MNLGIAVAIAAKGFKNKTDKAGRPYIMHCVRVMNYLGPDADEEEQCIAMLHDCPEDDICDFDYLRKKGFSERVITAVMLLTHDNSVPYMTYIKALAHNKDAVKVKKADLRDNSDITRLKGLTKKDLEVIEKYHHAYVYLSKI